MDLTATDSLPPRSRPRLAVRLKATGIHFALSLVIFVVLMGLIAFSWYPGPFFAHDGGWRGTLIIIGVDLVLGPALTFVVFDPRKEAWKTRLDLTVIGLIQVVALTWGVLLVEGQRPVAAAFHDGAFHPVTKETVLAQGGDLERVAALGEGHPPLVYVAIPRERDARIEAVRRWQEDGFALQTQPGLFAPLAPHLPEVARGTAVVNRLARVNATFRGRLDAFFTEHPELDRAESLFVPFYGRYAQVVLVLDRAGRIKGSVTGAFDGIL